MEAERFDRWTRSLTEARTRRGIAKALGAAALGALLGTREPEEAAASCRPRCGLCYRCHRGHCHKQRNGTDCGSGRTCQNGACRGLGGCEPPLEECPDGSCCATTGCEKCQNKTCVNQCRQGQRCDRTNPTGVCVCDEQSGCAGCCPATDGLCQPGDADAACGVGGKACVRCGSGEHCCGGVCCNGCCQDGQCRPGDTYAACGRAGRKCAVCRGIQDCCGGVCCGGSNPDVGCCQDGECKAGDDDIHCGWGGEACFACSGGTHCCGGGCCGGDTGFTCCPRPDLFGDCYDLQTDPKHCGRCDHKCDAGQRCLGGQCVCDAQSCPDGCCQGDQCRGGRDHDVCGTGGMPCDDCASVQRCCSGRCTTDSCDCLRAGETCFLSGPDPFNQGCCHEDPTTSGYCCTATDGPLGHVCCPKGQGCQTVDGFCTG